MKFNVWQIRTKMSQFDDQNGLIINYTHVCNKVIFRSKHIVQLIVPSVCNWFTNMNFIIGIFRGFDDNFIANSLIETWHRWTQNGILYFYLNHCILVLCLYAHIISTAQCQIMTGICNSIMNRIQICICTFFTLVFGIST